MNVDAGPVVAYGSWERAALERQVLRFVVEHGFVPERHWVKRMEQLARDYKPALKGVPLEQIGLSEASA